VGEGAGLEGLLAAIEGRREAARARMVAYLDSKKYDRFREDFGRFVATPGKGSRPPRIAGGKPVPYRVGHVAPAAIYERLAAVRAYGEWVCIPEPPLERLHGLRIACKRLRYTLEFFQTVLGPGTGRAINEIVALQDHLGALQDAVVARGILGEFLARGTWGEEAGPPTRGGGQEGEGDVAAYLAFREEEIRHLVETFPGAWQRIEAPEFSGLVAEAVAVL
jgi:CHAD domain-containing protein